MRAEPYMVMDDDMKKDASGIIPLESACIDGAQVDIQDDCNIYITVAKNKRVNVLVESARFDKDQYAGLDVEVDLKTDWDDEAGSGTES